MLVMSTNSYNVTKLENPVFNFVFLLRKELLNPGVLLLLYKKQEQPA